ncbi:MAG: tyrosine-type recombinase/integrase, partial [Chloroflexi bacterium]|nr:tyrosine-type recombinase/integrase [Chloroflexota bacterium]
HALRHSTATALLSEGVPLRVVADVLGHSTIVVTANVYAAVVPELRREAADAMDRALSAGETS